MQPEELDIHNFFIRKRICKFLNSQKNTFAYNKIMSIVNDFIFVENYNFELLFIHQETQGFIHLKNENLEIKLKSILTYKYDEEFVLTKKEFHKK